VTLLDCKGIQEYLGVGKGPAEALMRQLPKVQVANIRRVWIKKADLDKLLEDSTSE
jgi:hypothetical protein